MINAPEILQMIILAASGWTLLEVITLKSKFAALEQQIEDLPCSQCKAYKTK